MNLASSTVYGCVLASWTDGLFVHPDVTFQGDNGGGFATIASDKYEVHSARGAIVKKPYDSTGTAVDWTSYTAGFRATYSLYNPATNTASTVTNEAQTVQEQDFGIAPFDPVTSQLNLSTAAANQFLAGDYLSLGTVGTRPKDKNTGTGIWGDATGLYGLNASTQEVVFSAATGKITAGAGAVTLDANGLTIEAGAGTPNKLIWKTSGTQLFVTAVHADTTSPILTQNIIGTSSAEYIFSSSGSSAYWYFDIYANDATNKAYANLLFDDSTGGTQGFLVGVGTGRVQPSSLLHLKSTAPTFRMEDTTASAKSLLVTVDANKATWGNTTPTTHWVHDLSTGAVHFSGGPTYDIVAFGAIGDDSTDNTSFIQAAIDAAETAGGGIVFIPYGTFQTGKLTIPSNIAITGIGWKSILKLKNSANTSVIENDDLVGGNSKIFLNNFAVDGNDTNQTTHDETTCPVRFRNLTDGVISNLYISNATSHGIVISSPVRVEICGNRVTTSRTIGIAVAVLSGGTGSDVDIHDNYCFSNTTDGIVVDAGNGTLSRVKVHHNYCISNVDGIDIQEGVTDSEITNNTCASNSSDGIEIGVGQNLIGCQRLVISGNVSRSNAGQGIVATSLMYSTISDNISYSNAQGIRVVEDVAAGEPTGLTINNNTVYLNSSHGIAILDLENSKITNNTVFNNDTGEVGGDGIRIDNASLYLLVSGNRCFDDQGTPTQTYGIRLASTADYIQVIGNHLRGNVTAGYTSSSSGTNNIVHFNYGYDTHILGSAAVLGIGTSTPSSLLHLASTAPTFRMEDTTGSAKSLLVTTDANATVFQEAAAATDILRLDLANKNVVVNSAALATNATDGFLYITSSAGAPSGTPTTFTGRFPIHIDSTNHNLYFYDGSWRTAIGAAGAPVGSAFVTIGTDATLTSERSLTGTANQITVTDNGAGSTVVLSTPQNIHTAATPTFQSLTLSHTAPQLNLTDTTASAKSLQIKVDANLATFEEAGGTDMLVMDLADARVGIGTASPSFKLDVNDANTDPSGQSVGTYSISTTTLTTNNAQATTGVTGDARINQAGNNSTGSTGLRGVTGIARPTGSSGTVTGAVALFGQIVNGGAGTITNAYGVYTQSPSNSGTITNNYGLYVAAMTAGGTLNYALYTNTGLVHFGDAVDIASSVKSTHATAGIGYATGAGGTVTQATSKSTGVTLSKVVGQITMNNAALAGDTTVSFTLTNTAIAATDILVLNHVSGGTAGSYLLNSQCGAGSASINVRNITTGSLSEAIVIGFAVVKGATS